jgi:hypothetical protein
MKKTLSIVLFVFFLVVSSCSVEETVVGAPESVVKDPNPVVVVEKPIMPPSSLMKPAIRNTNNVSLMNKAKEVVRKRVVKSFRRILNSEYILDNMTQQEYNDLPTDNLYNAKEDSLNVVAGTKYSYKYGYNYNLSNQLADIHTDYIENGVVLASSSQYFEYETNGDVKTISANASTRDGVYHYNNDGLIDKMYDVTGNVLLSKYIYDSQGRISDSYDRSDGKIEAFFHDHYHYEYLDDHTFIKTRYEVNPVDNVENLYIQETKQFDSTKPGIYNKEAIYKLDNEYLHIIFVVHFTHFYNRPDLPDATYSYRSKYFYDSDGYLMKFDEYGLNRPSDITIYKYE